MYLYKIGYPNAITFLNGINQAGIFFILVTSLLRVAPATNDNYIVSFLCANQRIFLDFCFAECVDGADTTPTARTENEKKEKKKKTLLEFLCRKIDGAPEQKRTPTS